MKSNSINSKNGDWLFFGSLLFIILVCFFLLVPKVSSRLFPFKRQMIWNSFINETKQVNNIDEQKFWEFREFYSPGYFKYDRNGLSNQEIANFEVELNAKYVDRIFLRFYSPLLNSIDALTISNSLSNVINESSLDKNQVLFQKENELIYKDSHQMLHILFLKTLEEMKRANGFFDYNGADKDTVKGKYWLNVTELQLK